MSLTDITGSTTTSGKYQMERRLVLRQMNDDELQRLIPTIVFLAIISVLGVFGNGVVCHVYRTKYRLSNSQCFILCLSAIDLFTCSIAIPFEIVTVIDQYTFEELWLCKSSRFFNTIGTMSSSFLLLVIAIDRYRKVCKPFGWQISFTVAKALCGISVVFGLVLAVPAVFIYGKQTFEIEGMPVNGTECSTDDNMVGTIFPFVNAAVFGTLFVTGIVTICILYCLIGAEVKRHANTMPGQYPSSRNASVPMVSSVEEEGNSRISCELKVDINTKRESKRKSKYRSSKVKKSESDLSWTANNEDLSYSNDCTTDKTVSKDNTIELETVGDVKVKNEEINTDSDDSGIKSDHIIQENVDLEEAESNAIPSVLVDTKEQENIDDPGEKEKSSKTESDSNEPNGEKEINDDILAKKLCSNDGMETTQLQTPSLGNSPSTSDEQMINNNKYTKNERSRSRLSSISSRISNAIRRMTSVTSMTSTLNMRKNQYLKQARARKTAFLMFMISLAFVLSYLPHLLLMFLRQLMDDFQGDLNKDQTAVYKFFLRSYFLNSAINPIIYGVCDTRFRTACKEMFSCCKNKDSD